MHSERTLYPMMGVGAFNIMFWIGFVAAHNLGLACDAMLLAALFSGGAGCYGVVRLERASAGRRRTQTAGGRRATPGGPYSVPTLPSIAFRRA